MEGQGFCTLMLIIVRPRTNHVRKHGSACTNSGIPAVRNYTSSSIGRTLIILKAFGIYTAVSCNRVRETLGCKLKTNSIAHTILTTTCFAQVELIGRLFCEVIQLDGVGSIRNLCIFRRLDKHSFCISSHNCIFEGSALYFVPIERCGLCSYFCKCQMGRLRTTDTCNLHIIHCSRWVLTGSIGIVSPNKYHLIVTYFIDCHLKELMMPSTIQIQLRTTIEGLPIFRKCGRGESARNRGGSLEFHIRGNQRYAQEVRCTITIVSPIVLERVHTRLVEIEGLGRINGSCLTGTSAVCIGTKVIVGNIECLGTVRSIVRTRFLAPYPVVLKLAVDQQPAVATLEIMIVRQISRGLDSSKLFDKNFTRIRITQAANEEQVVGCLCEPGHSECSSFGCADKVIICR